ncbi:hypothetical protein ACFSTC_09310 [Nonomuraea ferruginea]
MYTAEPAGLVRTVLGDVSPESLGAMLVHEHLLTAPLTYAVHRDPDLEFGTAEGAAAEVSDFVGAERRRAGRAHHGRLRPRRHGRAVRRQGHRRPHRSGHRPPEGHLLPGRARPGGPARSWPPASSPTS